MNIATASYKRFLQLIALFAVLGITSSSAAQSFSVSPNSAGGTPVTVNGVLGTTVQKAFAVTNNTALPTTVFASVYGNAGSGFSLPGTGSVVLGANATGTLYVNYTPLTTATQDVVLRFFNGLDSVLVDVEGLVQRSFNVLPNSSGGASVSFDASAGASDSVAFTLTNNSPAPITVSSALSGSGAAAFSLGTTSTTINGGGTGTVNVMFNPSTDGTYNAVLSLINGIDTTLVNLTGVAGAVLDADFTVSPALPVTLNTNVNGTTTQTFTVTNTGDSTLTVNAAVTGGAAFSVNPGSATIMADSSATFTLTFNPTVSGTTNATLTFSANGDSTSVNVTGVASGLVNNIALGISRGFVEFNNVEVGTESCQTVYVTNNTGAAVTLREVTFVGVSGGGTNFQIDNNFTTGTQLAAGASDSIVVCFTPTQAGQTVTANLKLQYRATGDSTKNGVTMIRLEGNAEGQGDSLSLNLVDELNFDALPGETECQTLRLVNPSALLGGTAWLSLADSNAGFEITSGDSLVVGPLGTGFVTICYTGDSLNPNTSTNLSIVVLGPGNTFLGTYDVTLNGETELEIDEDITDSIFAGNCFRVRRGGNFGPVVVGGNTNQNITIENRTNTAATITAGTITMNGQATNNFSLGGSTTFPITIAPWSTQTVNVNFTPMDSTMVSYNAQLTFDVAGTQCSDLSVQLHGVGLPAVTVNNGGNNPLDTLGIISNGGMTGNVAVIGGQCESGTQTVAFQNNLNTAVTISGLTFTGSQASNFTVIGSTPALPATLQPGDIINIQVRFNCGNQAGFYTANLQLATQGGLAPIVIPFQTVQQAPSSVARAEESGVSISVSPNPTRGLVRVETKDAASARVEILNVLGQVVGAGEGTSFSWNAETAGVSAGVYMVRVSGTNAEGREFVETRQIVVE